MLVVGVAVTALVLSQVLLAQRPPALELKFGALSGANEINVGDPDGLGTAGGTLVAPDTLVLRPDG